jgi:hypothetical protein
MNLVRCIFLFSLLLTSACNAESPSKSMVGAPVKAVSASALTEKSLSQKAMESAINDFSKAVRTKDTRLFVAITNSKSLYLVRKFTSGTLGGRGAELSAEYKPDAITKEMSFVVKNQTPLDLPTFFFYQQAKPFADLPKYSLPPEIDHTHYDQWAPILLKVLNGKPEAGPGDSVVLQSEKYWIYAEAQVIDGVITGSFAAFTTESNKTILAAIVIFL